MARPGLPAVEESRIGCENTNDENGYDYLGGGFYDCFGGSLGKGVHHEPRRAGS
jgi:hypothetical protein